VARKEHVAFRISNTLICRSEDVPQAEKYLLVGSTEPYSGKSSTILGLTHQLQQQGFQVGYGKPIGTCLSELAADSTDEDVRFITQVLSVSPDCLRPTLLTLDAQTIQRRMRGDDQADYRQLFQEHLQNPNSDLVLLEGPGTLEEGRLFNLSVLQMADGANANVLLVSRFHSVLLVDALISARDQLGDRLIGVLINDIPTENLEEVATTMKPFLESQSIPVLGMLPRNILLRSVSVGELVRQLNAEVLCRPDRLDLMVESLKIGAMNVSAALKYFQAASNMAIVTGGDRTDIQLAALETSTQCLILTGQLPPATFILSRAEELEIPVLSVELDTLSTVEIIDQAFGQVRLHETAKVECIRHLMKEHFDTPRLISLLGLQTATPVS
jgi:BioD-like phosphotransacetylase family protein